MSLIDLYINDSGTIRRVGDNCHDQLTIDDEGRLHYYNRTKGASKCIARYSQVSKSMTE